MSDRHRQALLEGLGWSEESKTVNSAAVKSEEIGQVEDVETLEGKESTKFRSLAAMLNHMRSDRSEVQYFAKEICTMMANPTQGSWKRLRKGESWSGIGEFIRGVGGQMGVSHGNNSNEHRWKKCSGGEACTEPTFHEAGRARAVGN